MITEEQLENLLSALPENTPQIILDLTRHFDLLESPKELDEKMRKGGISKLNARKIATFCVNILAGNIQNNQKDKVDVLKKELKINNQTALKILSELEKNVFGRMKQAATNDENEKRLTPEPIKPNSDSYREKI